MDVATEALRPPKTVADHHEDGLGGSITILQPGDAATPLRFRMILPPGFGPPAPECHPGIREDFSVLEGTLDLGVVEGERVVLNAGDTFSLPPGVFHKPANPDVRNAVIECELTPGRDLAAMFRSLYAATREYRGVGQFVRQAMVLRRHTGSIWFPFPVRIAMSVAATIGATLGLRAP
jgi:mannose-6-phosphate isomerase-like protein (cupin superfamily)